MRLQDLTGLIDESGTSITVSGSVHSRTSTLPTGIFRSAFFARSAG
jgi:hypothetical protein